MRAHLDIAHEGTLGAEDRTRMSFDENSISHLMSVLTDLYSNPELAVIREYSTNAWDSHRAAGIDDPIEVSLPTHLNPVFVVRDHGVGLSVDEVTQQFAKYGYSSKRDTDDQAGMLGLGCKSGLTYTSQFTLVVRKNGVQATVLVTRDPDGAGVVQIVDTSGTDLPNGVEVTVPVSNASSFRWRAESFYRFWESGSVLVDGEAPTPYGEGDEDLRLDPDVIVTTDLDHDYLVMGNVPYPIDKGQRILPALKGVDAYAVARVPIGTVNFTPSREALQWTKRTHAAVDALHEFVDGAIHRTIQRSIEEAPNHAEALRRYVHWGDVRRLGAVGTYRYDCRPMPVGSGVPVNAAYVWWPGGHTSNSASRVKQQVPVRTSLDALHVWGHPNSAPTLKTKAKVQKFLRDKGIEVEKVYLYFEPRIDKVWFSGTLVVDYETIKAVELPKDDAAARSSLGAVRVIDNGRLCPLDPDEDLPTPLLYVAGGERIDSDFVCDNFGHGAVVSVRNASLPKFLKANPGAVHLRDYAKAMTSAWVASLTPWQIFLYWGTDAVVDVEVSNLSRLFYGATGLRTEEAGHLRRLLDRELAECCRSYVAAVNDRPSGGHTGNYIARRHAAWAYRLDYVMETPSVDVETLLAPALRYPILGETFGTQNMESLVDALNALYIVREQMHLDPRTF